MSHPNINSYSGDFIGMIADKLRTEPINSGMATFLNPYSYLKLRSFPELLNVMDAVYVDGFALVAAFRMVGIRVTRRSMDMTSLAPSIFEQARRSGLNVYFIGGKPGVSERAASVLGAIHVPQRIYAAPGYFPSPKARSAVISRVASDCGSVVLVGMGAIVQERFMAELRDAGHQGCVYSCGGFFHQTASVGRPDYYPGWVDTLNLRWLWRAIHEPSLARRYAVEYPKFVWRFIRDVRTMKAVRSARFCDQRGNMPQERGSAA